MKLALLYTYFSGFEQLKKSIDAMQNEVDEIVVCFQMISNKGEINPEVKNEMRELSHQFEKVWLLQWEPDLSKNTKQNERDKHDYMIQSLKRLNSTHFILSACDHIYSKDSFNYAKAIDADVVLTQMYTYYKQENWRLEPPETYYMPFIHKLYPNTTISTNAYPVLVDPSVKVNSCKNIHIAPIDKCVLHHYSMVREDIELKFRNAAASVNWSEEKIETFISEYQNAKVGDKITYFKGREIVEENGLIR